MSGRRPCRWASCGTKNVSYGIASSLLRSSITRRSVVPERPTPRTITGGAIAARLEDQLGERLQGLGLRRAENERRHRSLAPGLEPLGDPFLRPEQRDGVDQLVGHGSDRFPLLAAEIELLDPLGVVLPAVAAGERGGECSAPRAPAADA